MEIVPLLLSVILVWCCIVAVWYGIAFLSALERGELSALSWRSLFAYGIGSSRPVPHPYVMFRQHLFLLPLLYLCFFVLWLVLVLFVVQVMGIPAMPTLEVMTSYIVVEVLFGVSLWCLGMCVLSLLLQCRLPLIWRWLILVFVGVFLIPIWQIALYIFQFVFVIVWQLFY